MVPLAPQSLANAWWSLEGSLQGMRNDMAGIRQPVSSSVLKQPIAKNVDYIGGEPPDIEAIHARAGATAAAL